MEKQKFHEIEWRIIIVLMVIAVLALGHKLFSQEETYILFKDKTTFGAFMFEDGTLAIYFTNYDLLYIPCFRFSYNADEQGNLSETQEKNVQIHVDVQEGEHNWIVWKATDEDDGYFEVHIRKSDFKELAEPVKEWLRERELLVLEEK